MNFLAYLSKCFHFSSIDHGHIAEVTVASRPVCPAGSRCHRP